MPFRLLGWIVAGFLWVNAAWAIAAEPSAEVPQFSPGAIEFFETSVRPVLVNHCQKCHGAKEPEAGLRLDSRAHALKGGEGGPVIVAGNPEQSSLVKAIRYDGEIQMPPDGKLPPAAIEALIQWVKFGVPWPAEQPAAAAVAGSALSTAAIDQARRTHWAFQPVREPALPMVKNAKWPASPIDHFILSRLEAAGLAPGLPADRRTLIRRATFGLIGLPPTYEEILEFEADRSPEAMSKLVDRLLDSPHYGERWGRYWLDVARYSDTKGYVFQEERRYPFSYTYRDYVIRSLNEDLPYDRFLIEQIAADRLELGDDKRPLAAMGFLTLGRRFLNNPHEIIDDRIDVVMRGTQGLTVTCARCHDHKFDPIPTADYYSLYGVFASSNEPKDLPMIAVPERTPKYEAYEKELRKREAALAEMLAKTRGQWASDARKQVGKYLLAVNDSAKLAEKELQTLARDRQLHPQFIQRWRVLVKESARSPHPIFAPWNELAGLSAEEFKTSAVARLKQWTAGTDPKRLNSRVAKALADLKPASLADVADRYTKLFQEVDTPTAFPDAEQEALRQILYGPTAPPSLPLDQLDVAFDKLTRNRARDLQKLIDQWRATSPSAPQQAMVLVDNGSPVEPRIFKRGNPGLPGDPVRRQFLQVLSSAERKPFAAGSGRLEMAQAIASRDNPLTARVMVNRVWIYHFGKPLVDTPSDFGKRSQPPSHPELLDHLAWQFMADGWSLKKLHRRIMLSRVYQLSSQAQPEDVKRDPDNRLLAHANRKRLEFEALRDSLLFAAGRLDFSAGGKSVDLVTEPFTARRTVYGYIDRQNLEPLFRTFDFASPDATSPQRYATTVPQQALFMLNSPFVVEQARHLVSRSEVVEQWNAEGRIEQLYLLAYGRRPQHDELALAMAFVGKASGPVAAAEPPVWQYGYGEFDDASGRLKQFTPLPHFTGQAWQGGPELPDAKLGWVILNAAGGHVGNDQAHAAVRRWIAPRDGKVTLTGVLNHPAAEGDGVRARISSSRAGKLGDWTAHHQETGTEVANVDVQKGDVIDFVADCRGNVNCDSFTWSPQIRMVPAASTGGNPIVWNPQQEFSGPASPRKALDAWERLAQVLLLSNEFVFVD